MAIRKGRIDPGPWVAASQADEEGLMEPMCEGFAGEPWILGYLREMFHDQNFVDQWLDHLKNLEPAERLAVFEGVEEADLWLWKHNGALKCHAFALFVAKVTKQLWKLHQSSLQVQEGADSMRDELWGSW